MVQRLLTQGQIDHRVNACQDILQQLQVDVKLIESFSLKRILKEKCFEEVDNKANLTVNDLPQNQKKKEIYSKGKAKKNDKMCRNHW